jgi:hypothetical protein
MVAGPYSLTAFTAARYSSNHVTVHSKDREIPHTVAIVMLRWVYITYFLEMLDVQLCGEGPLDTWLLI